MIHNVITSIAQRLDEFIKNKLSIKADTVIVSNLVDIKGNLNQDIENKVTIFLLHIEEENITKNTSMKYSIGETPPVKVNLLVMFSAYFPNFNYVESLHYISLVIEFFQINTTFDDSNTPGLPISANKIKAELFNISIDEINKLWGNIGANYLPSVSYKFKHIIFDGETITQDIPKIV
ncbi:DUF4255 domain-containing protein [Psychroflexus planctonicus]|uniref:Pvc16 N-terminal domain-containing protein n=1 Tax=Psychroflexus planctonicus TaxID=1526575 RepID=A0ABQ1SKB7_9FLAO|nr:DUF4255 domain-containing protein [Psychroflexus planctonicus]GGE40967.1 hypothetical protein GCM10010832_21300 [Psychroflexus planctonicus]